MKFHTPNKVKPNVLALDFNGHKVVVTVSEFMDVDEVIISIATSMPDKLFVQEPIEFET